MAFSASCSFRAATRHPTAQSRKARQKRIALALSAIKEFARGGYSQRLLLSCAQALVTQMAQTAVCNRHHSIAQQFCHWLLLSLDRLQTTELNMMQDLIATTQKRSLYLAE